jgi:hypothetical protein
MERHILDSIFARDFAAEALGLICFVDVLGATYTWLRRLLGVTPFFVVHCM